MWEKVWHMRNSMIALILLSVILLSGYVLVQAQDNGPSTDELAQRARLAYLEGDLPTAIDLYAEAFRLAPENDDYLFEYARMLLYASRTDRQLHGYLRKAHQVAQQAVQEQPDSAKTQAAYALVEAESGLVDDYALEIAQRALDLDPTLAPAYVVLSLVQTGQGDWQQAERSANQAIELAPESIDAHRALALVYEAQEESESAIEQYEVAIQLHPNLDFLYFELAPFYAAIEDYDSALALYNTVLERDPDNVEAHLRTCETLALQRDDDAELANCHRALELDQTRPGVWGQIGVIHYLDRNYELAAESFAECVTLMDEQSWDSANRIEQCYYLQVLAHQLLDQCEQAEPLFLQALELENLSERGREITFEGMQQCGIDIEPTEPAPTGSPFFTQVTPSATIVSPKK
jgi:tetratricopeptide (TPR) repeat protein